MAENVLFPEFLVPNTPQGQALSAGGQGGVPMKGLTGAPVTQHTNITPAIDTGKSTLGAFAPAQFTDEVMKKPEIAPAKPAPKATPAPVATVKAEEKKADAAPTEDGINWLAVIGDALSGGLQVAGGAEKSSAGYTSRFLEQQREKQAQDAESKAKLAEIRAKYFGKGGAGAGTNATPIQGYKPIAGVDASSVMVNRAGEVASAKNSAMSALDQVDAFLKKNPNVNITDQAKLKEYDATVKSAIGQLKSSLVGSGVLSDKDIAYMQSILPKYLDPLENEQVRATKIQAIKKMIGSGADAQIRAAGFEPIEGATSSGALVSYMVDGKRYNIPAEKEKAFLAAKPGAKKVQ